MTIDEIRKYFPITSSNKIYLNHAAKSPFSTVASEETIKFSKLRQVESIEYFPELLNDKIELKELLGNYLNATPSNISMVQNTVEGLNLLVDSLNWQKDDEIIIFEKDFPSNVYPFLKLQKFGVKIKIVSATNYLFKTEDYLKLITPKTKLLTVSFVNFLTGQVADLQMLGDACKLNNTIFCVDSIQGCGAISLDVEKYHIDFISNGGHKWMMFPSGAGFIYFSEKLKELFDDGREGWLDREVPFDLYNWENPRVLDSRRFELGSGSDLLIAIARASMKWRNKIGHDSIEQRILENVSYCRNQLTNRDFKILSNDSMNFNSGIVSFYHSDAEKLYDYLYKKNITIAIRDGILRISPHFYNTEEDLNIFFDSLDNFAKK